MSHILKIHNCPKSTTSCGKQMFTCALAHSPPHSCGETFVTNYSWMNFQTSNPYTSHNIVKGKEVVRRNKEEKQRKIRTESRLDEGLKNLTSSDWRTNKSSQGLLSIALLKSSQNSAIARSLSVYNLTLGF